MELVSSDAVVRIDKYTQAAFFLALVRQLDHKRLILPLYLPCGRSVFALLHLCLPSGYLDHYR